MFDIFKCYKKFQNNLNYNQRLKYLNIDSLETRRKINILKIVFKYIMNSTDIPYNWKIMYNLSHNTRNGRLIIKPSTRNHFCDKNFFMYSINLFNE